MTHCIIFPSTTQTMASVLTAMYIDSFAYDDSLSIYEFNERSDEDSSFHSSRRSVCLADNVETDHSESTVANFSCCSFNSIHFEDESDSDDFNFIVPTEIIKSPSKASIGQKSKIMFGGVSVREYAVVVGCQDILCPLTLDWEYVEFDFTREEDYRDHLKPQSKLLPLSYQERKQIIAVSQDVSVANVKYLEKEMLDLQNNNYECDDDFHPDRKRGVQRVDSPPRRPSKEPILATMTKTATFSAAHTKTIASSAMTIGFISNRNDSPPRRPCNSHD